VKKNRRLVVLYKQIPIKVTHWCNKKLKIAKMFQIMWLAEHHQYSSKPDKCDLLISERCRFWDEVYHKAPE